MFRNDVVVKSLDRELRRDPAGFLEAAKGRVVEL
jgi:hypothetical protein